MRRLELNRKFVDRVWHVQCTGAFRSETTALRDIFALVLFSGTIVAEGRDRKLKSRGQRPNAKCGLGRSDVPLGREILKLAPPIEDP